MLQIDLSSDLREEPDIKRHCYFALLEPVNSRILNMCESNVGKYASICVVL